MKKTMKKLFGFITMVMAAAFMVSAVTGSSLAFAMTADTEAEIDYVPEPVIIESGDYGYQENTDGTITIAEYYGDDFDLEIPSEIDGLTVSGIGYQAFTYMDFGTVIIPESVIIIEARAFEYCSISDGLTLPAGIIIESSAFSYADLPEEVTIPEGAVVGADSFSYCEGEKILIVEPMAFIYEQAFSYNDDLKAVICADGSLLENKAFEYCEELKYVYLCGEVALDGEPFNYSDNATVYEADKEEFSELPEKLREEINKQDETEAGPEGAMEYSVGKMKFTAPAGMEKMSQPGYDLFLMNEEEYYLLGASKFPPASLDFEDEASLDVMVKEAEKFVVVKDAYQVRISGYPAIWIDIINPEDEESTGVYLYIAADDALYYMMFLNVEGGIEPFIEIAETISIGTDLSFLK